MVTPAGKDLLRNTIHTVKFHNRILEENEMWRQWDIEKGLTMMVSDDVIRKKNHRCTYHEKLKKAKLEKVRLKMRKGKNESALSPSDREKWDHGGFEELYPNEGGRQSTKSNRKEDFRSKVYKNRQTTESESSSSSSSSEEEVTWVESTKCKRVMKSRENPTEPDVSLKTSAYHSVKSNRYKKDQNAETDSSASCDSGRSHLWKQYKECKESLKTRQSLSKSSNSSSAYDNIKKKWDHRGFEKLYPDEARGVSKRHERNNIGLKRYKERESSSRSESPIPTNSSDEEHWEEYKKFRRMLTSKRIAEKSNSRRSSAERHKKHSKHKRRTSKKT